MLSTSLSLYEIYKNQKHYVEKRMVKTKTNSHITFKNEDIKKLVVVSDLEICPVILFVIHAVILFHDCCCVYFF